MTVSSALSGQFIDVAPDYWAYDYIEALAARQIINGHEEGHFRPMDPVTQSQFAAIVQQAFLSSEPTPGGPLVGVSPDHWAYDALAIASSQGFLIGDLEPAQVMTRGDALAALVNGLGYESDGVDLTYYVDDEQIPDPLRPVVAAATQAQLVVSYPAVNWLHVDRPATRAEVAAFVYQALVQEGQAEPLTAAPYVANSPDAPWSTTPYEQFVFSPDGSWLAGYGLVPTAAEPGLASGAAIIDIWQVETGTRDRTLRPVTEDFDFVDMVFTAADSLRVLSQRYYDTRLDTWNVGTGERSEPRTTIPFVDRQDGLVRLSADGEHTFVRGDVAGTRLINILQETVTYLKSRTTSATFDATGNYLAIAAQDTVNIFARNHPTDP